MPGFIVHQGATVLCTHGGIAQPTSVDPCVLVSGMSVVVITNAYAIAGCPLAGTPPPICTIGQWITSATRVFAGGQPVIVVGSQGLCPPLGQLQILSTQTRVSAT